MAKEVIFGQDARQKLLKGAEVVYKAVSATLGCKGRCLVIETRVINPADKSVINLLPTISKDGITVARSIVLSDPIENMGASLLREASQKTVQAAGDGTSLSCLLAYEIFSRGIKALDQGANPVFIREGINKVVAKILLALDEASTPVNGREIEVARIASNGEEEIARLVSEAVELSGSNGLVTIDNSRTADSRIDFSSGMLIESGMRFQDFITNSERGECVLDNPYLLLHERRITTINSIAGILEKVAKAGRSILILSEEFEIPIVALLLANLGTLRSCAVVAPYYGERRKEFLKDLAIYTKGLAITDELGLDLKNAGLEVLGQAEKITVTKGHTTVIGGKGDQKEIDERVAYLKKAIETTDNDYEKEVYSDRLAKLAGAVAVIRVGAATDAELRERKDRFEDAVLAVKCSLKEGVVAGGGIALLRASQDPDILEFVNSLSVEESTGARVVLEALQCPFKKILSNGGYDPEEYFKKIYSDTNLGVNALDGSVVNMVESGIIDPCRVVKQALLNASSLASTLLTTEGTITNLPDGEKK